MKKIRAELLLVVRGPKILLRVAEKRKPSSGVKRSKEGKGAFFAHTGNACVKKKKEGHVCLRRAG